jgi:hypothetical protein
LEFILPLICDGEHQPWWYIVELPSSSQSGLCVNPTTSRLLGEVDSVDETIILPLNIDPDGTWTIHTDVESSSAPPSRVLGSSKMDDDHQTGIN